MMSSKRLATNNNQLPEGYKKTEVGVIPEDWEAKLLGDIFRLKNGFSFKSEYFSSSGPIVLPPGNFKLDGGLYFNDRNIKRYSGGFPESMTFKNRDLLVVMTDLTPDCNLLGKPAFVDSEETILHNQRIGKINLLSENINPIFLYFILLSSPYLKKIKEQATGSTVRHTSNKSIYSISLPIPKTKEEQKAIAQTLSEVDALIATLVKHIAKKRNIKTGTMQQLLTGKTRLPGFGEGKGYKKTEVGVIPEDWKISHISNLTLSHKQGYYTKEKYVVNGTRLVRITDLYNPKIDYESMPMLSISDKDFEQYKIAIGDFLFARSGAIGRYGIVKDKINAIFGSYIIRFNFKTDRLLNDFFGYLFETKIIFNQLLSITQGSSNININAGNIKSLKIALPSITEQQALAQVLSDMDKEITALEKRRAKTQAIKQGMMQELLTGRTRLKIEHPDDPITKNSNG